MESKSSDPPRGSNPHKRKKRGRAPARGNFALLHLVDLCLSVLRKSEHKVEKVDDFAIWLGVEPRLLENYRLGEKGRRQKGVAGSGLPARFCALLEEKTGVDSTSINRPEAYRPEIQNMPACGILTNDGYPYEPIEFELHLYHLRLQTNTEERSDAYAKLIDLQIADDAQRCANAIHFLLRIARAEGRNKHQFALAFLRESLARLAHEIGCDNKWREQGAAILRAAVPSRTRRRLLRDLYPPFDASKEVSMSEFWFYKMLESRVLNVPPKGPPPIS